MNRITVEKYNEIKERYGDVASFAIWQENKPLNGGQRKQSWDMCPFIEENIQETIKKIKLQYVVLGINVSQTPKSKDDNYHGDAFTNFHSGQWDMNLMKALFEVEEFYGSYMTDIYKYHTNKSAKEVDEYFKNNPEKEKKQFDNLQKEIEFVFGDIKPIFVVCGEYAQKAFARFNADKRYQSINVCHYSKRDGKACEDIIDVLKNFKKVKND